MNELYISAYGRKKRKVGEKETDVVEEKLLEIIGGSIADKPPDELGLIFQHNQREGQKTPRRHARGPPR